jgi:hypothetical protein
MRPVVLVAVSLLGMAATGVIGGVIGGSMASEAGRPKLLDDLSLDAARTRDRLNSLEKRARGPEATKLSEIEALYHMPTGSDPSAHLGRWYCGQETCSRTLAGCVDIERRLIMESGPQLDGSACSRTRIAFCRLDGATCAPSLRKCASDFSPCLGVE